MTTTTAKLQALSQKYLSQLPQKNYNFQEECVRFLQNSSKEVLLIEMGNSLTVTRVKEILDKLSGEYGGTQNQMILSWLQLRSVADGLGAFPKLPNLVVFDYNKTAVDKNDVKMFEKLMKQLSTSIWKKCIIINTKQQNVKGVLDNIYSAALCTLVDQDDEMELIEKFNFKLTFIPTTSTLYEAASKGNLHDVVGFIETGADVDQRGDFIRDTPLHKAAEHGYTNIALKLLQHGATHLPNRYEETPLHLAAKDGFIDIVIILLKHGVDVNVRGYEGHTPLHCASIWGHDVVVKTLIEYGAEIDTTDDSRKTGLHYAAKGGHELVVKILLDYKAQVNYRDCSLCYPLHYAVKKNHLEIVKLLVELANADVNVCNKFNQTPLDIAKKMGRTAIEKYLTQKPHCHPDYSDLLLDFTLNF